jgi:hypothetical protein
MDIADNYKRQLRKVKGIAGGLQDIARNTLVKGCIEQGAYIQFGEDMQVYNLYEALLYAEGYELRGMYRAGSVQSTVDALVAELQYPTPQGWNKV